MSFWHTCNRELLVPKYHAGVPASVGLGSSRLAPPSFIRYLMLTLPSQQSRRRAQHISLCYFLALKFAVIFPVEVCQWFLPPHTLHNRSAINSTTDGSSLRYLTTFATVVDDGGVLNTVTCVMKLTRGKLIKQPNWDTWLASEYLQLDQYDAQGMFGTPVEVDSDAAVFPTVWTYAIKTLDGRYKARCTCDGSRRSGQARILDETNANCVDQTGARIFYSVSAVENLLIFEADVSNAFAEAPPPKEGFYIILDKAFLDWWINHKKRPPIPHGHAIPILSAMQGHPESPRLWEKHADAILREIGLEPTTHKPCLYTGNIHGNRVIFLRQVADFAIATSDPKTADILLDMLDERLSIPIKRQGYLDMFNGIILPKHGTTSRSRVNRLLTTAVTNTLLLVCLRISWPLPILLLSLVTQVDLRNSTLQLVILIQRNRLILPSV